jgi:Adenylate and Guanylate cyclase catalytic domain
MTMPDVHDQLLAARNATGSLVISYMPQVESADYDLWIEYSEQYKGWISDAANTTKEATIRPYIWEYFEPGEDGYRRRSLASCSAERRRTEEKVLKPSNPLNGPFSPVWTMSPVPDVDDAGIINYNLVDRPVYKRAVTHITETRLPVFLDVCDQSSWFEVEGNEDILQTVVAFPVFSNFEESAALAGVFIAIVPWENFFSNNLVNDTEPIMLVVSNTCDETFSFEVNGQKATFLAEEDLHDQQYDHLAIEGPFADLYNPAEDTDGSEHCVYTMKVYPTQAFEDSYKTNEPLIFSMGVLAIFMFTTLIFLVFDCLVQRRQNVLLNTARKQNAIVSSLFPKSIQQKLMGESKGDQEDLKKNGERKKAGKAGLRVFLNNKEDEKAEETGTEQPIADLFPETTIMFGDIVNFTAWSSAREPSQVFALLEAVYAEFDILAKRRRVFKVEVVGDCYVAVAGLPDPRSDHAVVMAKFAKDCMYKMREVTHRLEIKLGPGEC